MIGLRFTAVAQAAGVENRVTVHSGRARLALKLTTGEPTSGNSYRLQVAKRNQVQASGKGGAR